MFGPDYINGDLYATAGDLYATSGDDEFIGYEFDPETGLSIPKFLKRGAKAAYNMTRKVVPGMSLLPRAGGGGGGNPPPGIGVRDPRTGQVKQVFPSIPGSPNPGSKIVPFGVPDVVFNATSGNVLRAVTRAQRAILINKMVITDRRTGTTAIGSVKLRNIYIGAEGQFPTLDGVSINMYGPATDNNDVQFAPLPAGIDLILEYQIGAAPTGTDSVVVETSMQGLTYS